jgi:hypothetical protein
VLINAEIYIGDDQLDALATIKSREELIGSLLAYFRHQHRVISALQNQFLKLRLLKLRQRHNIKSLAQFMLFTMRTINKI